MGVLEFFEEIFRSRVAFISKNRFALGVIMGLHISRLLRSGYESIRVCDLWGVREESLTAGGYLRAEDLSRIVYGCGEHHIVYAPWTSIIDRKRAVDKALGIYTDGGRTILLSRGFVVVSLKQMDIGVGRYIIETPSGILHAHIDRDGVRDVKIPSKHAMAYERIVEAFKIYGSFKVIDAVNILSRDLGVDRAEARKIINDLIGMGLIEISSGYIQPQEGQE
ncbi:hypothetical protein ATG_11950 [Desulfurococcaceae archaeon AG1]|nr:hypothetical protein ATG_11950 [Desulfurococcaceae archaeon AG1]